MSEDDKKNISPFMSDLWQLIKKYYVNTPDPDAVNWADVINAAAALGLKYDVKPRTLQANLINAFLDYLDNKDYEMRKGRQT